MQAGGMVFLHDKRKLFIFGFFGVPFWFGSFVKAALLQILPKTHGYFSFKLAFRAAIRSLLLVSRGLLACGFGFLPLVFASIMSSSSSV